MAATIHATTNRSVVTKAGPTTPLKVKIPVPIIAATTTPVAPTPPMLRLGWLVVGVLGDVMVWNN